MGVFHVLCLLILVSSLSLVAHKEEILESVSRRLSGDSYTVTSSNSTVQSICRDSSNLTFLINKRRCVNNEELLNGIYRLLNTATTMYPVVNNKLLLYRL
jgi:hypothetical protein